MNRAFSCVLSIGVTATAFFWIAAGSVVSPTMTPRPVAQIVHVRRMLQEQSLPEILPGVRRTDVSLTPSAVVRLLQIKSIRRHIHRASMEYVYVIDGSGRVELGNRVVTIRAGDLVVIPAGTPHAFAADSGALNLLNVASPPDTPEQTTWFK